MSQIQHTVFFLLPTLPSDTETAMQLTVKSFNELPGIKAGFRAAGSPELPSNAETLSALDLEDLSQGFTHCMLVIADDISSLRGYLHSDLHLKEWIGHMKPAGAKGPPLVFDSPLALSVPDIGSKIQHTALYKLSGLPGDIEAAMQAIVVKFNGLPGIKASFREAGSPEIPSLVDTLAALDWPDKTAGFTHILLVIADDISSLKGYLHGDLGTEWSELVGSHWSEKPLMFNCPLPLPL